MMIVVLAAVVALGLIGGLALAKTVKNHAGANTAEASRRSHLLSAYAMLLMAVTFVIKSAIVNDSFRYLLTPLAVILVVVSLAMLRKNRVKSNPHD
ncbi:hypothetical protein MSM1_07945 [Mycobacterium sp. SM1]|uniref:hypothetical protein n=1 Tax=Mycobacterium sp. SM1 TaxID=2816243 RepID=UPI001BD190A9|nr:hypothetical protein [Mycobacterium sp. SM1]MBS4728276.1 hypothetical protein [Mycobacterium sp. SM1]